MKKILFLLLLLCLPVIGMRSQINVITNDDLKKGTPCDKMKFCIFYQMTNVNDTARRPYVKSSETMRLEIGDKVTLFYSDDVRKMDSLNSEMLARGERNYVYCGKITWRIYRGYPKSGFTTQLDKFGMERFACTEKYSEPLWTIVPDSAATILGYACHLATADYKGRRWSAWYTDDIPVGDGPWLLCGLPGLILKAYDAERQYEFETVWMKQTAGADIYYKGEKYEEIDRKTLNDIYRRYYADPVGYVCNNPNVKVTVTDEHGNPAKGDTNVPYNPIER